jgi:ABC-type phosphate transport system ATPase subunit
MVTILTHDIRQVACVSNGAAVSITGGELVEFDDANGLRESGERTGRGPHHRDVRVIGAAVL